MTVAEMQILQSQLSHPKVWRNLRWCRGGSDRIGSGSSSSVDLVFVRRGWRNMRPSLISRTVGPLKEPKTEPWLQSAFVSWLGTAHNPTKGALDTKSELSELQQGV